MKDDDTRERVKNVNKRNLDEELDKYLAEKSKADAGESQ